MRTFVLGDVHGGAIELLQVLELSKFDNESDKLIFLGDVVDRGPASMQCVDILLGIKNLVVIRGNHDDVWREFLETGVHQWDFAQGGLATAQSYGTLNPDKFDYYAKFGGYDVTLEPEDVPVTHHKFFKESLPYYIDDKNRMFTHGGFNRHHLVSEHKGNLHFLWDRDLWQAAMGYEAMDEKTKSWNPFKTKDGFTEVFIGHTPTMCWTKNGNPILTPMKAANVWNVDTGQGKGGVLTIMDVDTKEYWQSTKVELN